MQDQSNRPDLFLVFVPTLFTNTNPLIDLPVKSILRHPFRSSTSSYFSGANSTMRSSEETPTNIFPLTINVNPPIIFFSTLRSEDNSILIGRRDFRYKPFRVVFIPRYFKRKASLILSFESSCK